MSQACDLVERVRADPNYQGHGCNRGAPYDGPFQGPERQCSACWQWHDDPENCRAMWVKAVVSAEHAPGMVRRVRPPGLLRKAINFLRASYKHWRTGRKRVSRAEHGRRLGICLACPYQSGGQCLVCGCPVTGDLARKTWWADQHCPLPKPKW